MAGRRFAKAKSLPAPAAWLAAVLRKQKMRSYIPEKALR
jgi:hypothetical protein